MAAILGYGSMLVKSLQVVHGLISSKFFKSLKCQACRANAVVRHFFEQNEGHQRVQDGLFATIDIDLSNSLRLGSS